MFGEGIAKGVAISWESAKEHFEQDGFLRDIYVLGAGQTGWQSLLQSVRTSRYEFSYTIGLQPPVELPSDPQDAFRSAADTGCLLSIDIGGLTANCHFFETDDIEFDIDPREVLSEAEFSALLRFLDFLAKRLRLDVVLTPEGNKGCVLIRVTNLGV